jgi:glyoxylase-like metal-dependent hydrolase (beta-lactamase superfamily II)
VVRIKRVLAPNPGPFTGSGTNTWVITSENQALIVDPGPRIESHANAIVKALDANRCAGVLVTHGHEDHAPLANPLAADLGVPAFGYGPAPLFEPDVAVSEGSEIAIGSSRVKVIATPGHSDDHLCFQVDRVLFSGDHIMGGSSVMVEDLARYLDSLRKLRLLDLERIFPGHGDQIDQPGETIDWYIAHRLQREAEILAAMDAGAESVADIVDVVYADVDQSLHPLAAVSVAAHLRKLKEIGPG